MTVGAEILGRQRSKDDAVRVVTDVTCQLFHYGHIRLFKRIKKKWPGSALTVVLDSDEVVRALRGYLPVLSTDERLEMISSCRYVDAVYCARESRYPESLIDQHEFFVRAGALPDPLPPSLVPFYGHALATNKMTFLERTAGISSIELIERCADWWQVNGTPPS